MANSPTAPTTSITTPEGVIGNGIPPSVMPVVNIVRAKFRDYAELNRLIAGHETSDSMILLAMLETVEDFNTTPPLIETFTLSAFPSMSLLIRGTIVNILESVALLQIRNHLTYADGGGISVQVSDKGPLLMQWAQLFASQYENKKVKLKVAMNLRGALNGSSVPSEYAQINGFWDNY